MSLRVCMCVCVCHVCVCVCHVCVSTRTGTPEEQRRDSPIVELSLLLAECIQHGLRTIAFCKVRPCMRSTCNTWRREHET